MLIRNPGRNFYGGSAGRQRLWVGGRAKIAEGPLGGERADSSTEQSTEWRHGFVEHHHVRRVGADSASAGEADSRVRDRVGGWWGGVRPGGVHMASGRAR